jgi:hypothetical protein
MKVTHKKITDRVIQNLGKKHDPIFIEKVCDIIWRTEGLGKLVIRNWAEARFSIFKIFIFEKKKRL